MITSESIEIARTVKITDYLALLGFKPIKANPKSLIYFSPFREEKTASFHVYLKENLFYDFGDISKGKNIIDLVQNLRGCSFIEAVEALIEIKGTVIKRMPANEQIVTKKSTIHQITKIKPLEHPALVKYCHERSISFQVAYNWLKEIHSSRNDKHYFGVGFQNDVGGFVTRNALMKHPTNIGNASIKTIKTTNNQSLTIFEGYFDFLSAIEYYNTMIPSNTVIVLNSVANLKQAMPLIQEAKRVNLYLDNDTAGEKAKEIIKVYGKYVIDHSNIYCQFKDFNEFLISKSKPP